MKYANIKYHDVANGTGIRTSLFVSGCNNNCPGCFNKEAQDFNFGEEFTDDIIHKILDSVDDDFHDGISILGGEPLDPKNAPDVLRLVKSFRDKYGYDKSIWVYTGYIFENLVEIGNPSVIDILNSIDILVDGPFIESQKSLLLKFRGSRNQRIILSRESFITGKLTICKEIMKGKRGT